MIFIFFVIAAVLPGLNSRPIISYPAFVKEECTIPLPILKTKYPEIKFFSSFLEKLHSCENSSDVFVNKLCEDSFTVLSNISTCNPKLKNVILNLNFEVSEDTCSGFVNHTFSGNVSEYVSYRILKNKDVCDLVCNESVELCEIFLWALEVQDALFGRQVTVDSRMPSSTIANNKPTQKSSSTPALAQLTTPKVDIATEVTTIHTEPKPVSSGNKLPHEANVPSAERKALKPVPVTQTKGLATTKKSISGGSPPVTITGLPVTNTSQAVIDSTQSQNPPLKNDGISKNHIKIKTIKVSETAPNIPSKDNEQNATPLSITSKTPSSTKGVQTLTPKLNTNTLIDEAFSNEESFEYFPSDAGSDNDQGQNKLGSSKSGKLAKTSSATHTIGELGSKTQESESSNQDSTGIAHSTKPKGKPDKSLPSEDTRDFDSNDKANNEVTSDGKSTDEDHSLPEDGSEKQKFSGGILTSENQNIFPQENANFFFYFLFTILFIVACYVLYHNKQKIIALIVEGCHERRRRPHSASYRKLEVK